MAGKAYLNGAVNRYEDLYNNEFSENNMSHLKAYYYIIATLSFTIYAQLAVKYQMSSVSQLPDSIYQKISLLLSLLFSFWILSAIIAVLIGALFFFFFLTKLELSQAYPFMSVSFLIVPIFSALLFNESLTLAKIIGALLIGLGICVSTLLN